MHRSIPTMFSKLATPATAVFSRKFSATAAGETLSRLINRLSKVDDGFKDVTRNMELLRKNSLSQVSEVKQGDIAVSVLNVSHFAKGRVVDYFEKSVLHVYGFQRVEGELKAQQFYWRKKFDAGITQVEIKIIKGKEWRVWVEPAAKKK